MELVITSRDWAVLAPDLANRVPMGVQLVGGKSVLKKDWQSRKSNAPQNVWEWPVALAKWRRILGNGGGCEVEEPSAYLSRQAVKVGVAAGVPLVPERMAARA
jgi:hypothetical protein